MLVVVQLLKDLPGYLRTELVFEVNKEIIDSVCAFPTNVGLQADTVSLSLTAVLIPPL